MSNSTLPPISYSTYIDTTPEVVYTTLSTGDGWNRWFTTTATVDARPGGSYRFHWEDWAAERETVTLTGPVVEAQPARVFAFQWETGEAMTTVRFELEPRAPGTIVRLTETGYSFSEVDVRACLSCAGGWGEALTLLKFYLEHGVTYGPVPPPHAGG
jgi:uncharacterized protein YndB with AHSA1/START domain